MASIAQEWNDSNLAWNASEYGNITSVRIPPAMIWKPDILLYNRFVTILGLKLDGENSTPIIKLVMTLTDRCFGCLPYDVNLGKATKLKELYSDVLG